MNASIPQHSWQVRVLAGTATRGYAEKVALDYLSPQPDKYQRRELRFHFGIPNDRDEWTINMKAWDRYCFMVEKHERD